LKYIKDGKHELVKLARSYEEFIEGDIDWPKDAVRLLSGYEEASGGLQEQRV
jgi:hypothetical protein